MPASSIQKRIATDESSGKSPKQFSGFQAPTSNTTYTPNQFFDVCLRNGSRGTVRLVSYVIRKTLGWCDEVGKPQEDQIRTPYEELRKKAGISRDMIRRSIDEAVDRKFLRCVKAGKRSRAGESPTSGLYELKWWDAAGYETDPDAFEGFFEGEGNRTYIPNQFFDEIVPIEPLAVIKVVGSVIRSSIGYEAKRGHRRQDARLSFTQLQRFTGIKSRATLSEAIKTAIAKRYINVLEEGVFHPDKRQQRTAVYSLCWADSFTSPKNEPEDLRSEKRTSPKNEPENRSDKCTRTRQISEPEDQSESRTSIKIKPKNETNLKAGGSDFLRKKELLLAEDLNPSVAEKLAGSHSMQEIVRQIDWIDKRKPSKSRGGLLKMAIEQDFAPPAAAIGGDQPASSKPAAPLDRSLEREAHKERHLVAFLEFLIEEEDRIKRDAPEGYTEFLSKRAAERKAMLDDRKPWVTENFLQRFDGERGRLKSLQTHFHLVDFWQWDHAYNPSPISSIASKLPSFPPTSTIATS